MLRGQRLRHVPPAPPRTAVRARGDWATTKAGTGKGSYETDFWRLVTARPGHVPCASRAGAVYPGNCSFFPHLQLHSHPQPYLGLRSGGVLPTPFCQEQWSSARTVAGGGGNNILRVRLTSPAPRCHSNPFRNLAPPCRFYAELLDCAHAEKLPTPEAGSHHLLPSTLHIL